MLAGAYRLVDARAYPSSPTAAPVVHLVGSGAVLPEVLVAAAELAEEGIAAHVVDVTSAGPALRGLAADAAAGRQDGDHAVGRRRAADGVLPDRAPLVTVHDASSHAMAWLGSALGVPRCRSASTSSASPAPSPTSTSCTTSLRLASSTPRSPPSRWPNPRTFESGGDGPVGQSVPHLRGGRVVGGPRDVAVGADQHRAPQAADRLDDAQVRGIRGVRGVRGPGCDQYERVSTSAHCMSSNQSRRGRF